MPFVERETIGTSKLVTITTATTITVPAEMVEGLTDAECVKVFKGAIADNRSAIYKSMTANIKLL